MTDALVKSAIAHWAPRFVANGVALTDFEEVTAGDRDAGTTGAGRGAARAAVHEAMGREALQQGKLVERRRASAARRRLLPLRQVRVRARRARR